MKQWHSEEIGDILAYLHTDVDKGLTREEAGRRLDQVGTNELRQKVKKPLWQAFLGQFADFMVLVLLAAAVISFLLGEVADCITIFAIVLLNAVLGFVQEYRAEKSLEALQEIAAPEALVCRSGQWGRTPAQSLVPGDIVRLSAGDIVPADVRLVEVQQLEIQEAALTGESEAVRKHTSSLKETKAVLGERLNMAFMGTVVVRGQGLGVVVDTGMETEMGRIADLLQDAEEGQTPLQRRLAHMGKWLVICCLLIVLIVVITGISHGEAPYQMFLVGVSLAVAAIPEGLPAIVTVALAIGVQRMLKEKAIIRRLPAVETLGCATVICSDKTGTLTQNAMTVSQIFADGCHYDVTGQGYQPDGEIKTKSRSQSRQTGLYELLACAVLCNNARLDAEKTRSREEKRYTLLGEPTEGALLAMAGKAGIWREKLEKDTKRVYELPFDSNRKRMSVVCQKGNRYQVYSKGAPDWLLENCSQIYWQGELKPLTAQIKAAVLAEHDQMAAQALRVLAFAAKETKALTWAQQEETLEQDLIFLGLVGMIDPPRKDALQAVQQCHQAGIRAVMITGDHKATAEAIAGQLAICQADDMVITGSELDELSDKKLAKIIDKITVFARVTPEHKLRIVNALKAKGHVVAMTGDGINDAPAVKAADIGIAMGQNGTDVTKEASDMILSDDRFATIVSAIREGRGIYDNIRKFIRYLLSCNTGEVLTMFVASLMGLPIPLLPIQILWVNLVTDGLPAMALSVDPIAKDVMNQKPRSPQESIFAHGLVYKIALRGMLIGASALAAYILGYYFSGGSLENARTMAFATLVFSQLFHVFDCRSEKYSIFEVGLTTNRYLLMAVGCSALMQLAVIYWPFLQGIFQTTPLDGFQWLIVLTLSGAMTMLFAVYRFFCRLLGR